jgi:hypothetical protein
MRATEALLWRALVALRIELLRTATNYGVTLAREDDVAEWRGWVGSLEGFLVDPVRTSSGEFESDMASGLARPAIIGEWFDQLRTMLDRAEKGEPVHADLASLHEFWWDSLERLAERARDVEELGARPLGEQADRDSRSGATLLGGIEDSLVLVLADADGNRDWYLTSSEVCDLVKTAQRDGVWGAW